MNLSPEPFLKLHQIFCFKFLGGFLLKENIKDFNIFKYLPYILGRTSTLSLLNVLCLSGQENGANKTKAFVKRHSRRQNEE